jgi:hypothetical protein
LPYSLSQAAEAVGMNRSSILRAIKAGKISATRDEHDQWQIEPAELHRIYPAAPAPASRHTDELIAELRARLEDMRAALAKAELHAGTWHAAFERELAQRALPTPSTDAQQAVQPAAEPSRFRRAWRWMRATGCLSGAGLLLVLATGAAGAQQQQQQPPQQQPTPGCFTVEMSHSTQGNPQGSILLDRCTGKTWLLLCIRSDNAGCASHTGRDRARQQTLSSDGAGCGRRGRANIPCGSTTSLSSTRRPIPTSARSSPDFPGAVTTAPTLDEAIKRTGQALALHAKGMLGDGKPLPEPKSRPGRLLAQLGRGEKLRATLDGEMGAVVEGTCGFPQSTGGGQRESHR